MKPQAIVLEVSYRGDYIVFAGHSYRYAGIVTAGELVRWAYLPVKGESQ